MSLARSNGTATAFSYDAAGNVARLKTTGPAGALISRYAYAYDGRGSVAQTLGASGTVSSWHMWGAFGEQEAGSSLGELPSYGYNAEEAHPQTGLQYLRARYYDASTGRFGVQDSYLGQTTEPLTLNRYLYCLSDPLNWLDPDGHLSRPTNYRVHDFSRSNRTGRLGSSVINVNKMKGAGSALSSVVARLSVGAWVTVSSMAKASVALRSRGNASQANAWLAKARNYRSIVTKYYCGNATRMRNAILGTSVFPDELHFALSVLGVSPYGGVIANGVNGVLYLGEGKPLEAAIAFAGVGIGVKLALFGLGSAGEVLNVIVSMASGPGATGD